MAMQPPKMFSSSITLYFKVAFHKINNCEVLLKNSLQALFRSLLIHIPIPWNNSRTTDHVSPETIESEFLTLGEINMVMGQLGLQECCGSPTLDTIDIQSVFINGEDPSLSEVKMAFDVFDDNFDGFIDEFELQRVLGKLGQQEKATLGQCRNMIKGFDTNGDGVIDFDEFVGLMETCSF